MDVRCAALELLRQQRRRCDVHAPMDAEQNDRPRKMAHACRNSEIDRRHGAGRPCKRERELEVILLHPASAPASPTRREFSDLIVRVESDNGSSNQAFTPARAAASRRTASGRIAGLEHSVQLQGLRTSA
ncbi:hypothetical protein HPB50_020953 [Hyalomma asiaticum]|uniref:Uncharacterized protein n=1 Tax=Hyalomma asiaticum TaxID=266040 RepID=A0ACB7T072_HYAAI|nr:hypothetical protein HPB50_020953 [Hyalomma asiaticum]